MLNDQSASNGYDSTIKCYNLPRKEEDHFKPLSPTQEQHNEQYAHNGGFFLGECKHCNTVIKTYGPNNSSARARKGSYNHQPHVAGRSSFVTHLLKCNSVAPMVKSFYLSESCGRK